MEVPFLAIKERRRDLLPEDPNSVEKELLERSVSHLRRVLFSRKPSLEGVHPKQFFIEANLVAFSPSQAVWERFARYYADLSLNAFKRNDEKLRDHYPVRGVVEVPEFLSVPRPYPELKLYHNQVWNGKVYLMEREPYFSASLLFKDILTWLETKVRKIVVSGAVDDLKDHAVKALTPPYSKKRKGYEYIQRLIGASGIPDGRKRILFYWLIPYWVSVEGKSPEEVLELVNEWLSRQAGGKIYSSWILSEAENVRSKGIKPWSIQKVERIDPELVKMLRGMKVL